MKFKEILQRYKKDQSMSDVLSGKEPIKIKAIELEGTPAALSADEPSFDESSTDIYNSEDIDNYIKQLKDQRILDHMEKLDKINKKKLKSK